MKSLSPSWTVAQGLHLKSLHPSWTVLMCSHMTSTSKQFFHNIYIWELCESYWYEFVILSKQLVQQIHLQQFSMIMNIFYVLRKVDIFVKTVSQISHLLGSSFWNFFCLKPKWTPKAHWSNSVNKHRNQTIYPEGFQF